MMKRNIGIILLAAIFCGTTARAYAQTEKDNTTTMPAKDRWAFETNAADWLFLAPNVGVEFDLSNSINNRWVIGANIKWNGNAKVKMDDRIQMGINDYRLEVKRYAKPTFNIQYGQARILENLLLGILCRIQQVYGYMGQRSRRGYVPPRTDRRMATARIQVQARRHRPGPRAKRGSRICQV